MVRVREPCAHALRVSGYWRNAGMFVTLHPLTNRRQCHPARPEECSGALFCPQGSRSRVSW